MERLAKIKAIIGIKDATGKVERAIEMAQRCGKEFVIYSGDDATAYDLLINGAKGIISVTSNVAPRKMHDFCKAALSGNNMLAEKLNAELMPLHIKLFLETNPVPTKWALHRMGLIPEGIRLPLLSLDTKYHAELAAALVETGVLHEKAIT